MTDVAGATAGAHDATIAIGGPAPDPEDLRAEAVRVIAAAEAKVEKQRAHLAGAQESLAVAKAALASIEGA